MNKYLQAAYEQLPGHQQALQLADEAQHMLNELRPPAPIAAELYPLNCGKITAEWLAALDEHDAQMASLERRRNTLLTIKRDGAAQAASLAAIHIDKLLSHLQAELTRLLHEAFSVAAQLHGASTAEQAVESDDGAAAWRRLSQLAGEYRELRAAQRDIMRYAPHDVLAGSRPANGEGDDHASDLYIANLDSLWPSWRTPDYQRAIRLSGTPDRLEPWPADEYSPAMLLWLVQSNAQAWVPTLREVDALRAKRVAKQNPLPRVVPGTIKSINEPARVR